MHRPSASSRRLIGLGLALTVGTGVGLGAYSLGSAAGTDTVVFPSAGSSAGSSAGTAATATATGTASAPSAEASGSSPLTLEEAMALAVETAPGRVIEWDEDHEPTGLRYDLTLLHDNGSTTDVEVDTVTGRVTSIDHDTDGD